MVKKSLFVLFILLLSSCLSMYSSKKHYEEIDLYLEAGDYSGALLLLEDAKDRFYNEKDAVLYYLELGMLHHYAGNYLESNYALTQAELKIEENYQKEISKIILSGVLNDNALNYAGEDYEDIYINIFKSLNYLHMDQFSEAMVEIRRVNDKVKFLENRYSDEIHKMNSEEGMEVPSSNFNFYNNAFARYLGVLGYRTEGSKDSARIEAEGFVNAFKEQKMVYDFNIPTSPSFEDKNTYINFISLTGGAPEKVADTIGVNTGSDFVYLDIEERYNYIGFNSFRYRGHRDGVHLKFQFPRLEKKNDPVEYIEVFIDGKYWGSLEYLESLGNIATETFKVKQPLIIGKTVTRALSKAVVSEVTENLVTDEFGAGFGLLADLLGSIYMEVSENSDLRIARYLPGNIRCLELPIDEGIYDIELLYYNLNDKVVYRDFLPEFKVIKNRLNMVETFYIGGL